MATFWQAIVVFTFIVVFLNQGTEANGSEALKSEVQLKPAEIQKTYLKKVVRVRRTPHEDVVHRIYFTCTNHTTNFTIRCIKRSHRIPASPGLPTRTTPLYTGSPIIRTSPKVIRETRSEHFSPPYRITTKSPRTTYLLPKTTIPWWYPGTRPLDWTTFLPITTRFAPTVPVVRTTGEILRTTAPAPVSQIRPILIYVIPSIFAVLLLGLVVIVPCCFYCKRRRKIERSNSSNTDSTVSFRKGSIDNPAYDDIEDGMEKPPRGDSIKKMPLDDGIVIMPSMGDSIRKPPIISDSIRKPPLNHVKAETPDKRKSDDEEKYGPASMYERSLRALPAVASLTLENEVDTEEAPPHYNSIRPGPNNNQTNTNNKQLSRSRSVSNSRSSTNNHGSSNTARSHSEKRITENQNPKSRDNSIRRESKSNMSKKNKGDQSSVKRAESTKKVARSASAKKVEAKFGDTKRRPSKKEIERRQSNRGGNGRGK